MRLSILFWALCVCPISTAGPVDWWQDLDKEQKIKWSVAGSAAVITAYGLTTWDYGERDAHFQSEGWFGFDTNEGGADKLGHVWTTYTLGQSLMALYRSWGYEDDAAARYGAWASFGIMSFMEFGDAFSRYGFSPEDFAANALGSLVSYRLDRNPELARKLDLRVEYNFQFSGEGDLVTDYENSRYFLALKLSGFEQVRNPLLKHLEFHLGYYARGFSLPDNPDRGRHLYLGLGLNLSKLFGDRGWNKTSRALNYFQPTYTSAKVTYGLDRD